jgi:hypothetical protein
MQETTTLNLKDDLLRLIQKRRKFDQFWAVTNFIFSIVVATATVLASFLSAIIAAADIAPPITVAILAAIPGTVIVIEGNFLFTKRWRWHNAMENRYRAFENQLLFEGADIAIVSKELSIFLASMEEKYPKANIKEFLHFSS